MMFVSKVFSRVSRNFGRRTLLLSASRKPQQLSILPNEFHSDVRCLSNKLGPSQVILFQFSSFGTPSCTQVRFSSSASPEPSEKDRADPAKIMEEANADDVTSGGSKGKEPDSKEKSTEDLSRDDLIGLVTEKNELLKLKHKEMEQMQDKVLRTYAEMENVMDRTRRDAENSKKFAIQSFAKSLLDVADNLGRASSVVKESFSKVNTTKDSSGAVPILKTLLEGMEMTEKQLSEVFRKFGVEKFDPLNDPFDPHIHNAIFQIPDNSKPPGTVAAVLKTGYMLYDRVIRPAEVGVTQAAENNHGQE